MPEVRLMMLRKAYKNELNYSCLQGILRREKQDTKPPTTNQAGIDQHGSSDQASGKKSNLFSKNHVYLIPISLGQHVISRSFPKDSNVRLVRRLREKHT